MTAATSSRRNSRRSSISSESSNTNHSASSKPKNSYIQKNSTSNNILLNGHKSRSGNGFSSQLENRTFLGTNDHFEEFVDKSESVNWVLNQNICTYKDFKDLIECKNEQNDNVLRKYSGIKNAKSIRQVLSSIVKGSKIKNRSASMENVVCDKNDNTKVQIKQNIDSNNQHENTIINQKPQNEWRSLSHTTNNEYNIKDGCNGVNNLPVLTGPPIQKSILTQKDLLELRTKIDQVLSTEDNFVRSSLQSFQQFDTDNDGNITIEELLDLLTTLGEHLALPPINRKVVANEISIRLNSRTTVDSNISDSRMLINFPFFLKYFLSVLTTIRQKHFCSNRFLDTVKNRAIRKHLVHEDDINDLYTFHYQLGTGTYGEVYLVTENYTRQRRACKIVDKIRCSRKLDEIDHEVEILKQLDHPGIAHIYEVYEDRLNLYIIQEYCSGGNLLHSLQDAIQSGFRFSEYHVSRIIQQILLAIRYLHLKRVVHKNLKPQNILLTNSFGSGNTSVKLIDFGLSEIFSSNISGFNKEDIYINNFSSIEYNAPEMIKGQSFSYGIDIWAVGIIMYCIITGYHPFKGKNINETKCNICSGIPSIDEISCISQACKSLLKRLLEKNPRDRISIDEALSHDWFSVSYSNFSEVDIGAPLLAHLKVYTKQSDLRHLLIHMLSHQLALDTTQINMTTSIFRLLDTDNDGMLSTNELSSGLQKIGISTRESSMIIKAMDIDGNGVISYSEFISACHIWRQNEIRQLKSFFMKIDKDNDGKITRDEFKQLLKAQKSKLLSNITKSFSSTNDVNYRTILPSSNQGVYTEWDTLLDEIDTNRDGEIDWKEFCNFIVEYFNSSRESIKTSNLCIFPSNNLNLPN